MPVALTFDTNAPEIARLIKRAGERRVGAVQNVINRYAAKIAREAKGGAPLDSGKLRASIGYELSRYAAEVFAKTEYAATVELGRRDNPNYPVQPFLRPALEANRADFLRDLRAALENG